MFVGGPLDIASFEHVTSDPATELFEGRVIYRTDIKTPKVYQNGSWQELGSAAGGAGEINYVTNPDGELGVADWNEYSDTPATSPVDGTGGTAGDLTLTANSTAAEVIRGDQSFKLAKAAANAQGQGISTELYIDNSDKNKLLKAELEFWTTANYADDDIAVFIYDVDNATLITPTDNQIPATSGTDADTSRRHSVQWSSTGANNYRLIIHVATTNATAYDFHFDNVIVGPGKILTTPAIEGWEEVSGGLTYSNSTAHAPSNNTAYSRRVGENLELMVIYGLGGDGTDSGDIAVTLPYGLTIDASFDASTSFGELDLIRENGSSDEIWNGDVIKASSTQLRFQGPTSTGTHVSVVLAGDDLGTSNDRWRTLKWTVSVPIAEWSGQGTTNALVQDNLTELFPITLGTNFGLGGGTQTSFAKQVGDCLQIFANLEDVDFLDVADFEFTLPSSYTLDTSKVGFAALNTCGSAIAKTVSGDFYSGSVLIDRANSLLEISGDGNTNGIWGGTSSVPNFWTDGTGTITFECKVPVEEFAGTQNSLVGFTEATTTREGLKTVYDVEEDVVTASVPTVTTDVYVDSGASLTLTAGYRYEIGYNVTLHLEYVSGALVRYASVGIFNSSDVRQGNSEGAIGGFIDSTSTDVLGSISRTIELDVTSTDTYKLRHRCSHSDTIATARVEDGTYTGSFSNPDEMSYIWARRIAKL